MMIINCRTRSEVAKCLANEGFEFHIGGRHVAALAFGRRVAIITDPSGTIPDFN